MTQRYLAQLLPWISRFSIAAKSLHVMSNMRPSIALQTPQEQISKVNIIVKPPHPTRVREDYLPALQHCGVFSCRRLILRNEISPT